MTKKGIIVPFDGILVKPCFEAQAILVELLLIEYL